MCQVAPLQPPTPEAFDNWARQACAGGAPAQPHSARWQPASCGGWRNSTFARSARQNHSTSANCNRLAVLQVVTEFEQYDIMLCLVGLIMGYATGSRSLTLLAQALECLAGLHNESLVQAEQQLTLVCGLLTGVRVPCDLALMQVDLTFTWIC